MKVWLLPEAFMHEIDSMASKVFVDGDKTPEEVKGGGGAKISGEGA